MSKAQGLCMAFLEQLKQDEAPVSIFLVSGIKIGIAATINSSR
jgi:sRNA-binding regulator protein Hfq